VHAIFNQNTNFDETTLIWLNFDHQSIFVPNLHTKKKRWKSIHSKTISRSNKVKTDLIKSKLILTSKIVNYPLHTNGDLAVRPAETQQQCYCCRTPEHSKAKEKSGSSK